MKSSQRPAPPPDQTLEELRIRCEEAEETLNAIRTGQVDSLVVWGSEGEEIVPLNFLDLLPLGILMTDPAGRLTFLNAAACRLLDTTSRQSVGADWKSIIPVDPANSAERSALLSGQRTSSRLVLPLRETEQGPIWIELDVQHDPRDPQRRILFLRDVTDLYSLRSLLDNQTRFHDLVGKSEAMKKVFQNIRDAARVDSSVLIEGETGTGKELVARAIHYTSRRKAGPFIAVNCAALTESLASSQLFGHRRGAFTGAIDHQEGFFEAAQGGTIFLDEVTDIPLSLQPSLLRVLELKEILRVGESRPREVDVRVLAASNRGLKRAVEEGHFRADLMYRIRIMPIELPPLRARKEDIPLLARHFLQQFRFESGRPAEDIGGDALRSLIGYSWPGNVRELRNAVEVAVNTCGSTLIEPSHLPPEITASAPEGAAPGDDFPSQLRRALKDAGGNRSAAARLLGISRATLYRRLADLKKS